MKPGLQKQSLCLCAAAAVGNNRWTLLQQLKMKLVQIFGCVTRRSHTDANTANYATQRHTEGPVVLIRWQHNPVVCRRSARLGVNT